jgi:hypothetical protein
MTPQDDLPEWLRGLDEDDQSAGSAASGPAGGAQPPDADLPPWLRSDDEPASAASPAPQTPDLDLSSLEAFLAAADALPQSIDTGMTYDDWVRIRSEAQRPRSLEEEIPDLFVSSPLTPSAQPAEPVDLASTGDLPDWFLGLDELDTSDAPEWFTKSGSLSPNAPLTAAFQAQEDAYNESIYPSAPENPYAGTPDLPRISGELPAWMSDLVQETPPAAEPETDAVSDFFSSLSGTKELQEARLPEEFAAPPPGLGADTMSTLFADLAQDEPELGWVVDQPAETLAPSDTYARKMDDFFSGIRSERTAAGGIEADPDELPPEFAPSAGASTPSTPASSEEIEEPDLDWFLKPVVEAPPEPAKPPVPAPADSEPTPVPDTDSLRWLSEIEGIVSSIAAPDEPERDITPLPGTGLLFETDAAAEPEPAEPRQEFDWGDLGVRAGQPDIAAPAEVESAPTPALWEAEAAQPETETDWLSTLAPDAAPEPPPDAPSLADVPRPSLLTGRLARSAGLVPEEPPPPQAEPQFNLFDDLLPEGGAEAAPDSVEADLTFSAAGEPPASSSAEMPDLFAEMPSLWGDDIEAPQRKERQEFASAPAEPLDLGTGGDLDDFFSSMQLTEDLLASSETPPARPGLPNTGELFARLTFEDQLDAASAAAAAEDELADLRFDLPFEPETAEPTASAGMEAEPAREAASDWGAADEDVLDLSGADAADLDLSDLFTPVVREPIAPFDFSPAADEPASASSFMADMPEAEQPDLTAPTQEAEALEDIETGWLTDDLFAETGAMSPPPAAQDEPTFDTPLFDAEPADELDRPIFDAIDADAQRTEADWLGSLTQPDDEAAYRPPRAYEDDELIFDSGAQAFAMSAPASGSTLDDQFLDLTEEELADSQTAYSDLAFTLVDQAADVVEPAPDRFAWSGAPSDAAGAEADDLPDLFADLPVEQASDEQAHPASAADDAAGFDFSLFELQGELPPADDESGGRFAADQARPAGEPDWLTQPEYEEAEAPAVPAEDLSWLEAEAAPASASGGADLGDLFGDLDEGAFGAAWTYSGGESVVVAEESGASAPPEPPAAPVFEDIDSYLAQLDVDLPPVGGAAPPAGNIDIEQLLAGEADALAGETAAESAGAPAFVTPPDSALDGPEWLNELGVSVSEHSATAMIRQARDRSLDELDERLKRLRQRAEAIPETPATSPQPDTTLASVLPGLGPELLAPAALGPRGKAEVGAALVGGLMLTPDQQARAALLAALVASTSAGTIPAGERNRLSPIELTYDHLGELADDESAEFLPREPEPVTPPAPAAPARRRARQRPRLDRLAIGLLLLIAIALPQIVPGLRLGELPPVAFAAGSRQERAFAAVEALRPGSVVLIAVEYGASAAAELDVTADALLRHVLLRGAYPVVVGGDGVGLLHAETLLASLNSDLAFLARLQIDRLEANRDYFVTRFLPGGFLGLRAFAANTASFLLQDLRGQVTGLTIRSLADFALIAVISDRVESVRGYAEQIAPLADAPVIAAVSYSAAPLIEPYTRAGLSASLPVLTGLLVGFADSFTYHSLIGTGAPPAQADAADGQPAGVESVPRGERPQPLLATLTPTPTHTPTFTLTPTATLTPTLTPTPPPSVRTRGQTINVRGGPGTNNPVIGQLRPGAPAAFIGYNADSTWINVLLPDGTQGWVSAELVEVIPYTPGTPGAVIPRDAVSAKRDPGAPEQADVTPTPPTMTRTPRPTRMLTPVPAVTAEPTAAAPADPGAAAASAPPPVAPITLDARAARWDGMTGGLVAAILIISFGSAINIVRALARALAQRTRQRRGKR